MTEVHWRIIANLGFKFQSQFTVHCGRGACGREGKDHRREEWRDHLALCKPLLGALVRYSDLTLSNGCIAVDADFTWPLSIDGVFVEYPGNGY